ncbi:MAG TPA: MFS transporter [Thermoleophilaceae bacterium]|jgi:MFS family permease|nr:MFS transporter [Thermoleophilaceae bacterium]
MRRLLLLICAIVLVDTSFYAAITPLLPYYADHNDLTKTGAGLLVGAYPAGTLVASIPSGALAARVGPRALLVAGLALLAVTSVTFGLAHSIVVLDLARFAQGIGGALSWTGGMGWLSSVAPRDRRGAMMGTAMAAATGGALLGPVLGAVARAIGPAATFGAVGVIAAVLLVLVLLQPRRAAAGAEEGGSLRAAIRQPLIARGLWLVACTALCFGVINVLLPLRMDRFGASGAVIAVTWLLASALEAVVNPVAGRRADRHGWAGLARFGLVAGAGVVLVASVPQSVALLALIGVASGPLIGVLWTPGLVLLGSGSDEAGFEHTYAFALMNLAWATAQTIATAGGGALAHATHDIVPYALVASVALVTAATMTRPQALRRTRPAMAREA